jgi:hypothetical protein
LAFILKSVKFTVFTEDVKIAGTPEGIILAVVLKCVKVAAAFKYIRATVVSEDIRVTNRSKRNVVEHILV